MTCRTASGRTRVAPDEVARNTSQPTASSQCGLTNGHSRRSAPRRRVGGAGVSAAVIRARRALSERCSAEGWYWVLGAGSQAVWPCRSILVAAAGLVAWWFFADDRAAHVQQRRPARRALYARPERCQA